MREVFSRVRWGRHPTAASRIGDVQILWKSGWQRFSILSILWKAIMNAGLRFKGSGFNVLPLASCFWLLASNLEPVASSMQPATRSRIQIWNYRYESKFTKWHEPHLWAPYRSGIARNSLEHRQHRADVCSYRILSAFDPTIGIFIGK